MPATGQTLSWSTAQIGNPSGSSMLENQQITITFTGQTTAAFAVGALSQNRVKAVGTRTFGSPSVTQTFTATDFAYVTYGNVGISKTSSVPAATPLYPGDTFTYTTTVTNPAGSGTTLTGVSLLDPIPSGVGYVAGSGSVTCELAAPSNVRDEFASAAYNLNGPNNTANWAGNWPRTMDMGSPRLGRPADSCGSRAPTASCSSGTWSPTCRISSLATTSLETTAPRTGWQPGRRATTGEPGRGVASSW